MTTFVVTHPGLQTPLTLHINKSSCTVSSILGQTRDEVITLLGSCPPLSLYTKVDGRDIRKLPHISALFSPPYHETDPVHGHVVRLCTTPPDESLPTEIGLEETIDVRPVPEMINAMNKDLDSLTALCELIDNSLQATKGMPVRTVDITWNFSEKTIIITDNGHGVQYNNLDDLLRVGKSLNNQQPKPGTGTHSASGTRTRPADPTTIDELIHFSGGISRYGFGLKSAVYSLSNTATIQTRSANQNVVGEVDMNLTYMNENDVWETKRRTKAIQPGDPPSFTRIIITNAFPRFWDQRNSNIMDQLALIYYFHVHDGRKLKARLGAADRGYAVKRGDADDPLPIIRVNGKSLAETTTYIDRILAPLPQAQPRAMVHTFFVSASDKDGLGTLKSCPRLVLLYFPVNDSEESAPVPESVSLEGVLTFWQGRFMPSATTGKANPRLPAALNPTDKMLKKFQVPYRCLRRVRMLLFLDGQFEPISHKSKISDQDVLFLSLLKQIDNAVTKEGRHLRDSYLTWLSECRQLDKESRVEGQSELIQTKMGAATRYFQVIHGGQTIKEGTPVRLVPSPEATPVVGLFRYAYFYGTPEEMYRDRDQKLYIELEVEETNKRVSLVSRLITCIDSILSPREYSKHIEEVRLGNPHELVVTRESQFDFSTPLDPENIPAYINLMVKNGRGEIIRFDPELFNSAHHGFRVQLRHVDTNVLIPADVQEAGRSLPSMVSEIIKVPFPRPPKPGVYDIMVHCMFEGFPTTSTPVHAKMTVQARRPKSLTALWVVDGRASEEIVDVMLGHSLPRIVLEMQDAFKSPWSPPPNLATGFDVRVVFEGSPHPIIELQASRLAKSATMFEVKDLVVLGCSLKPPVKEIWNVVVEVPSLKLSATLQVKPLPGDPKTVRVKKGPRESLLVPGVIHGEVLPCLEVQLTDAYMNVVRSSRDVSYYILNRYPGGSMKTEVNAKGGARLNFTQPLCSPYFNGEAVTDPFSGVKPWVRDAPAFSFGTEYSTKDGFMFDAVRTDNTDYVVNDFVYIHSRVADSDTPYLGVIKEIHRRGNSNRIMVSVYTFWQKSDLEDLSILEDDQEVLLSRGVDEYPVSALLGHAVPVVSREFYQQYRGVLKSKKNVFYCDRIAVNDTASQIKRLKDVIVDEFIRNLLKSNGLLKCYVFTQVSSLKATLSAVRSIPILVKASSGPHHISVGMLVEPEDGMPVWKDITGKTTPVEAGSVVRGLSLKVLSLTGEIVSNLPRELECTLWWLPGPVNIPCVDGVVQLPALPVPKVITVQKQQIFVRIPRDLPGSETRPLSATVILNCRPGEPRQLQLSPAPNSPLTTRSPLRIGQRYKATEEQAAVRLTVLDANGLVVSEFSPDIFDDIRFSIVHDLCELENAHIRSSGYVNILLRGTVRDNIILKAEHPDLGVALLPLEVAHGQWAELDVSHLPESGASIESHTRLPPFELAVKDACGNVCDEAIVVSISCLDVSNARAVPLTHDLSEPVMASIQIPLGHGRLSLDGDQLFMLVPTYTDPADMAEYVTCKLRFEVNHDPRTQSLGKYLHTDHQFILKPRASLVAQVEWTSPDRVDVSPQEPVNLSALVIRNSTKSEITIADLAPVTVEIKFVPLSNDERAISHTKSITPHTQNPFHGLIEPPKAPSAVGHYQAVVTYVPNIPGAPTITSTALDVAVKAGLPAKLGASQEFLDEHQDGVVLSLAHPVIWNHLKVWITDKHGNRTQQSCGPKDKVTLNLRVVTSGAHIKEMCLGQALFAEGENGEVTFERVEIAAEQLEALNLSKNAHAEFSIHGTFEGRTLTPLDVPVVISGAGDTFGASQQVKALKQRMSVLTNQLTELRDSLTKDKETLSDMFEEIDTARPLAGFLAETGAHKMNPEILQQINLLKEDYETKNEQFKDMQSRHRDFITGKHVDLPPPERGLLDQLSAHASCDNVYVSSLISWVEDRKVLELLQQHLPVNLCIATPKPGKEFELKREFDMLACPESMRLVSAGDVPNDTASDRVPVEEMSVISRLPARENPLKHLQRYDFAEWAVNMFKLDPRVEHLRHSVYWQIIGPTMVFQHADGMDAFVRDFYKFLQIETSARFLMHWLKVQALSPGTEDEPVIPHPVLLSTFLTGAPSKVSNVPPELISSAFADTPPPLFRPDVQALSSYLDDQKELVHAVDQWIEFHQTHTIEEDERQLATLQHEYQEVKGKLGMLQEKDQEEVSGNQGRGIKRTGTNGTDTDHDKRPRLQ